MYDIMKIVKSLEEAGLLIKEVGETIKNEAKERKYKYFDILLDTSGASWYVNNDSVATLAALELSIFQKNEQFMKNTTNNHNKYHRK